MPRVRLVRGSFDGKESLRVAVHLVLTEARSYWKFSDRSLQLVAAGVVFLALGLFVFRPLLGPGVRLLTFGLLPLHMALLAAVLVPVGITTRLIALRLFGMKAVQAEEREQSNAEITAGLTSGGLSPLDLVQEDGGWKTLHESREFGEPAEARHRRDERIRLLKRMVLVACGMALFACGAWLLSRIPEAFMWLATRDYGTQP